MQKPAKYTVVCWTRFWVNFESMKKRALFPVAVCDRDFCCCCLCLCLQARLLCLQDSEGF